MASKPPLLPPRSFNPQWRSQHYVDMRAGMPDPARADRETRLAALSGRQTVAVTSEPEVTPFPAITTPAGAIVGTTDVQTLTNKTLTDPTINIRDSAFRVQDNGDATKQLAFEVGGIASGTTRTVTAADRSGTMLLSDGGVKSVLTGSVANDPPSTANGSAFAVSVTVTGVAAGDVAFCGHTSIGNTGWRNYGATVETDTVRCVWVNNTGVLDDPGAGTAYVVVFDVT